MKLFPKVLYKWNEPKLFATKRKKEENNQQRWWQKALFIPGSLLLCMTLWYLSRFDPNKDPVSFEVAISISTSLGIFLGYVVPWLNLFITPEIKVTEKFIGRQQHILPWDKVESFSFYKDQELDILKLRLTDGTYQTFGLEPSIGKNCIKRVLQDQNIEQEAC